MKWRLFFQNNNSVPVRRQWGDYDSKEAALRAACGMMKVARVSVLYIEDPDGNDAATYHLYTTRCPKRGAVRPDFLIELKRCMQRALNCSLLELAGTQTSRFDTQWVLGVTPSAPPPGRPLASGHPPASSAPVGPGSGGGFA
jgi:hypothetical protein